MSENALWYLTIREAGALLRTGQLSPVELTRTFLERIDRLDKTLQAYITVLPEPAMAAARVAEAEMLRGDYKGPLHGIPIALKDLYDTRGIKTTASSRVMAQRAPRRATAATCTTPPRTVQAGRWQSRRTGLPGTHAGSASRRGSSTPRRTPSPSATCAHRGRWRGGGALGVPA